MAAEARVVVVFFSGTGSTAQLAEAVAGGAAAVKGVNAQVVDVSAPGGVPWAAMADADAIIFGSPTHMGSVAAGFKGFMDASARVWLSGGWRDKIAAAFVSSGNVSGDKLASLIQLSVFAAQHGMVWIGLDIHGDPHGNADGLNRLGSWLGAMAQADRAAAPENRVPPADLRTAAYLGERVARATLRWRRGNLEQRSVT